MFSPIPQILDELRAGRMIVLTDDENRENEGDLVLPAQMISPESITFMLTEAKGYMCLSLTEEDCQRLDLSPQVGTNTSVRGTPLTVSIDGHPKHGFTTGVSAKERANTIKLAIDPDSRPHDFVRPGHINPLRARQGGVLIRTGQTEGSVDLCRLAGLTPAAVIIEIMRDDGEMARLPDLEKFCAKHELKICSVAQVIQHRLAGESLIKRMDPIAGTKIRTPEGEFNLIAFESLVDPMPHIALTVGGVGDLSETGRVKPIQEPTLVRMHRRNLLGDVFGDVDSSPDVLHESLRMIQQAGRGVVVYLRPEGIGDGLNQRLLSIRRPAFDPGANTPDLTHPNGSVIPEHMRDIGVGGQILRDLGLTKLQLLSNHQTDLPGLDAYGLEVTSWVPIARS